MIYANKNFPLVGPSRTVLLGTLAALAFAANCAGAPGTVAFTGFNTSINGPGGFIYDGASTWVTDATLGLCRMDPAGTGFKLNTGTCILPPTTKLGTKAILGQPAYDPITKFVYLPDMSTASKGIWRYAFNGSTFGASASGFNIASTSGLGVQQPGALAIGNLGGLYASMTANAFLMRITTPEAATQTVATLGVTHSGFPARGLAFVSFGLWIADVDGEMIMAGAEACGKKCGLVVNTQVGVLNPLSIAWDVTNSYVYLGTASGVFQYNVLTGQSALYSKFWETCKAGPAPCAAPTASGILTDVTAVGVDPLGNLFYADDPTASQILGGATVYTVPAGSLPDGLGNIAGPPPTIFPTLLTTAPAGNPALFYAPAELLLAEDGGVVSPEPAVFMGTHLWMLDATLGFCKVDPTLPAPSLSNCVVFPVGFTPGAPAYDKLGHLLYVPDNNPAGSGIVRIPFLTATETLGAQTIIESNTVLTAIANPAGALPIGVRGHGIFFSPSSVAIGVDGHLYVAMNGTTKILKVTAPSSAKHAVTQIGDMFEPGSISIAFNNSDLYDIEIADSSIIYNATLCTGTCTSLFFGSSLLTPQAVVADGTNVYIADASQVLIMDTVANTLAILANVGVVAGVPTAFVNVTGLALDGLGHIFAVDAGHVWVIDGGGALPTVTSLSPFQAPEGSSPTVTITGTNFLATSLVVSTCAAITPGNVTVISANQITATFAINPVGPLGPCNITVTTLNGATAVSAASSFTVLIGPPALTSITPLSGFRGRTIPVSIAGANMGLGTINPIPGITITNSVVNAAGTLLTANFVIDPTAPAPVAQTVIVSTPSGPSNSLTFTITAAPPVLTGIAPTSGVANSTVAVTLTGTDLFQSTVNAPAGFTISGTPVVTPTSVKVTFLIASTVAAGPKSITVTGPGGISNGETFTILPALTSIAPVSAKAGAGTLVTLTGTSLAGVTTVNAGANITVTGLVATANTVTATFTSALSAPLGAQSVTVTDVNGTSSAVTFTLTASVPVLTSITPVTGGTGATVAITLTGTGLLGSTLTLPAGVVLSGTPVISFSQITATIVLAGNAPLGLKTISVTTAGGTSNTVNFTVFALAPLLNTIAPTFAAAGTTTTVTLTGTGLTGTTSVNTAVGGGITVNPGFTVNAGGTQLTATFVIALNAITQQISVTNTNGTSNAVTFGIVPTLSSISPASKPAGLSVLVTLTGTSLIGATSIGTGTAGITVSGITVVSSTQITATFTLAATAVQGNHNITVTTPGGTTTAVVVFNVLPPPPAITSINSPFTRGSNQGVTLGGTSFTGATTISAVQVFLNGTPVATSALTVTGFQTSATQLRWSWTIPSTAVFPVSSGTNVYTITVTTPSGTSAPFAFTVK